MKTTANILKGTSVSFDTVGEMKASYVLKPNVKISELPQLSSPEDSYRVALPMYDSVDYIEAFGVLFLNTSNRLVASAIISIGGVNSCIVDPKVILQHALLFNAVCLVLVHNHPSGGLKPSSQDKQITTKIIQACKALDMRVVDHLIITKEGYFSFCENGLIEYNL